LVFKISIRVCNNNPIILLSHCFPVPSLFLEMLCFVVGVGGTVLAPFQVREARNLLFDVIDVDFVFVP